MITGGTALAESTDTITEAKEAGLAMPIQSNSISGWPEGPAISSPAAILMDMDTGAVLYAKNINDQHYPASITKIMTRKRSSMSDETLSLEYFESHC